MALRFRKSIKIAPGVRLNVGKKSTGISVGVKRNYRSTAYQQRKVLERQLRELEKMQEMERNRLLVEEYENLLELLTSVHKESLESNDWEALARTPEPFKAGEKGTKELAALQALEDYKPNFLSKLLKLDIKKREKLRNKVEEARREDQADYEAWEKLVTTAKNILNRDLATYLAVIDEVSPFDDLTAYGSGFRFQARNTEAMEIEFDVQLENVIPQEMKSLTKTGKLSIKEMPKTKYNELQQDYVCSCVIRIARDMFALLPVQTVVIHAFDKLLNTSTGYIERVPILSVKIDRPTLSRLNLDEIDCSDAMANFEHRMKFKKMKGFEAVEKVGG